MDEVQVMSEVSMRMYKKVARQVQVRFLLDLGGSGLSEMNQLIDEK